MANMSDAYGTVSVESVCNAKKFVEIINKIAKCWEYPIYFNTNRVEDDATTFTFNGSGRWTMSASLENFGESLDYCLNELEEEEKVLLINNDWELSFNYLDCEPGCGVLYIANDIITHKKGQSLKEVGFREAECSSYDYTLFDFLKAHCDFEGEDYSCFPNHYEEAISKFLSCAEQERVEEIASETFKKMKEEDFRDSLVQELLLAIYESGYLENIETLIKEYVVK